MDSGDLATIIGSFAAMLAGFFFVLRYALKQGSDDRANDRKERQTLTLAIQKMAKSSEKVALATEKGNKEAKERNGHLGEQNVQLASMLKVQTEQLSTISSTLVSSAVLLAKDTEVAHKGTEEVKKALIDNKTTGTFNFSGNLE